jgi:hypothetical protein
VRRIFFCADADDIQTARRNIGIIFMTEAIVS